MELGKGTLPRTGLNALHQAVHPIHGLAWTDGHQVVLIDLQLHRGEVKFGSSKAIGQFEHVAGVSWAPQAVADTSALLAVQHQKHVTVWQLSPRPAEKSKWLMSQCCEIRTSMPILPRGCVWHPHCAVLTVLTARDVSVFHNIHRDSARVRADIGAPGPIHCACWTQDGLRLVVAVDSSLHSYIWDSAQKTLHPCSFSPAVDVDSSVCCISATVDTQVILATELPLGKICGLHASASLGVRTSSDDTCPSALPVGEGAPSAGKEADASGTKPEMFLTPGSHFSDLVDLTHVRFKPSWSEGSSLIFLREKNCVTGTGLDSSHLVLVTFKKDVTRTRKVPIPGILVPDLIAFNLKAQLVAVASNTYNMIFIYSVVPSFMPNIQKIQLESSERPKGICFLTDKLLLILVGKPNAADSTFLPSSKSEQYVFRLVVREVTLEEFSDALSESQNPSNMLFETADGRKPSRPPDFCHQNRELLLTADPSRKPGSTLIKEIKSPPAGICDDSAVLETLDANPNNHLGTLPRATSTPDPISPPEPPDLPPVKTVQDPWQLSKEMDALSWKLTQVQQCLSELAGSLLNGKRPSPVYPLSRDLPYVHITCQSPSRGGCAPEKRAVLLCGGKLRLSTVQQTFGLALVEMLHDSHWVLLSADTEGFIPITFTATQEIVIRDGSLRARDAQGHSVSES
ncbi:WD repeat and coiled-coil-containing protein [Sorex araneus]|uniref:WD repeat and coiled-coil-containing protein n=1 Tax=Sorex araneus TaxID=42254 RepID=UPI002433D787|nr:WD repeat and coiled-coil-containing protein [Sorex araneus]